MDFTKDITCVKGFPGSSNLVPQMRFTHFVGSAYKFPACVDFNSNGDLLCIGYKNKQLVICDWMHNQTKFEFNSKHTEDPSDVKFINVDDNALDIISTSTDGQIRRAIITPTGKVTTTRLYKKEFSNPRVAIVPGSSDVLIASTSDGRLFHFDLRCKQSQGTLKMRLQDEEGNFLSLNDIAHHPFAPEICACSRDKYFRIFDTRNLGECVQKLCADVSTRLNEIYRCSYNFNGSEILANYLYEKSYIFNNQNHTCSPANFPAWSYFLGPKSEYVVSTASYNICLFRKDCSSVALCASLCPRPRDVCLITSSSKPHRFLPVIASPAKESGVAIWQC